MYSALQIARYLINYGFDKNIIITNLNISKYIYLLDNIYYKQHEKKLVVEECGCSKHGGIIYSSVYYEYRKYSIKQIDKQYYYNKIEFNKETFMIEQNKYKVELIDDYKLIRCTELLFKEYGGLGVWDLVDLTKNMLDEEA